MLFWYLDVFHNTTVCWSNWWQTKQCFLVHWLYRSVPCYLRQGEWSENWRRL